MCEFGWHFFVNPLALVPGLRGIFYRVGNSIPPDLQRRVRGMYNVQQTEWQKPHGDAHQMAVTVSFFTRKLGFCPLKTVETPLIGSRVHNCLINTLFFPSFINSTFSTTCFEKILAYGVVFSYPAHFFVVIINSKLKMSEWIIEHIFDRLLPVLHHTYFEGNQSRNNTGQIPSNPISGCIGHRSCY